MINVRRSNERGHADHGWLNTYHTFSFAGYQDPDHMGFRSLRVMNEDRVEPGKGFGMHGHRDMEIVSYVISGALAHEDSMGNASTVSSGGFQKMSAGSGVEHSEFNPSPDAPAHFYQIWVFPEHRGLEPSYQDLVVPEVEKRGVLRLVASPERREDALWWDQDARLYLSKLDPGEVVTHPLAEDRHLWVQVVSGSVRVHGEVLAAGDGAAISQVSLVDVESVDAGEVLLFDLA